MAVPCSALSVTSREVPVDSPWTFSYVGKEIFRGGSVNGMCGTGELLQA